jgi:hypothetical protein
MRVALPLATHVEATQINKKRERKEKENYDLPPLSIHPYPLTHTLRRWLTFVHGLRG